MLTLIALFCVVQDIIYVHKPSFIERCDLLTDSTVEWISMNNTNLMLNGYVCSLPISNKINKFKVRYYFIDNKYETSDWIIYSDYGDVTQSWIIIGILSTLLSISIFGYLYKLFLYYRKIESNPATFKKGYKEMDNF